MDKEESKIQKEEFNDILNIIENARFEAYRAVNRELINMYRRIGEYISEKVKNGVWGKSTVNEASDHIRKNKENDVSGFSARNLWRMKQFYEAYKGDMILSTLSAELSWSLNIRILGAENDLEREFYLKLAIKNNYSYRELDRQMASGLYERVMISKNFDINAALAEKYEGLTALRSKYVLEFLAMPKEYKEKDLRKAIVGNLKYFMLEFGKEFSLIGEEYRLKIGENDYYIDLLFFNRELKCLVAVELKKGSFRPEHAGQMQFYLEALDRDVRKPGENMSVGLILCTDKNDTVVEYTLSKSMTPSMIADYELALPDKKLLRQSFERILKRTESTGSFSIGPELSCVV